MPTRPPTPTRSPTPTASPTSDPTGAEADSPDDQTAAGSIEATVDWQGFVPTDVADHLATMDRAARESDCGVPWQLLAAIARVESDFGRNMGTSSAGAIGYGQFLPSSWQTFGSEGNAYDYRDALPAIALYLCRAGLERDPRAALFAYNHADWYVDLVLDLAVRYDRMAPGAPIPDVLDVGPSGQPATPMRYAAGRDLRQQTHARAITESASWLGVPWHGRAPRVAISRDALDGTVLTMLRTTFGVSPNSPESEIVSERDPVNALADRTWEDGLLPLRSPSRTWSMDAVKQQLQAGRPVVALVEARALPGHPPDQDTGDQWLVLIGTTPTGVIYSDPTFSSSLGYGLELSDEQFQTFWDSASTPRQALAFTKRPAPLPREAHLRAAEPPPAIARVVLPTATPAPPPTLPPTPAVLVVEPTPTVAPIIEAKPVTVAETSQTDWSWLILVGSAAFVVSVFAFRLFRPRA